MKDRMQVRFAGRLLERMVGLIRKDVCPNGEVLVLLPCRSIHTLGMKEDIDVAFIDARGYVIKVAYALSPRRFLSCATATATLERRSGSTDPWFETGDCIRLTKETAE